MNQEICKGCKRYVKNDGSSAKWWCAKEVFETWSVVVPGHLMYHRNKLHKISSESKAAPEWCEYVLEQSIATPEDKVSVTKAPTLIPVQSVMEAELIRMERGRSKKV